MEVRAGRVSRWCGGREGRGRPAYRHEEAGRRSRSRWRGGREGWGGAGWLAGARRLVAARGGPGRRPGRGGRPGAARGWPKGVVGSSSTGVEGTGAAGGPSDMDADARPARRCTMAWPWRRVQEVRTDWICANVTIQCECVAILIHVIVNVV
jgi:hypothetical protein